MRNDDRNWFDEYRFRRADGSYVYILDQAQKFYDESGTPILIAGADERHHRSRQGRRVAARRAKSGTGLLTEISPDGVVIAGGGRDIHLANQSMQRMLGVAPEQVIGRNLSTSFRPDGDQYRGCLNRSADRRSAGEPGRNRVSAR